MSKRYIGIHIVYMRMSENTVATIFSEVSFFTRCGTRQLFSYSVM